MEKIFTIDDYMNLVVEDQNKVNMWLHDYELDNATLIISRKVVHSVKATDGATFSQDEDLLTVYGDLHYRWYKHPGFAPDLISNSSGDSFHSYTRVAEFGYDDFPWEVKYK